MGHSVSVQVRYVRAENLAGCGTTILASENFEGPRMWHNRRTLPPDAQKGLPARPQRVKARGVPSGVR